MEKAIKHSSVAPRAGAWIEIGTNYITLLAFCVAPRAGAWIEMGIPNGKQDCGDVAPRAGAWIEIGWGVRLFGLR